MSYDDLWKKPFKRLISQRDSALPPAWVVQSHEDQRPEELGRHVHISGRGRDAAQRLGDLIGVAREQAVVSSFLLADEGIQDAMLEAARRGVRVYVLLASEARLGREDSDDEFDRRVLVQHKAMLTQLAGHVLFRSAPHFHAKLVLVDPHSRPAGALLNANLTKEALERNEELAVELTPDEVREAAALAGWAMWESAEHEMVDPDDRFRSVKPLGSLEHPRPGSAVKATTAERNELREVASALVDGASERLMVASFGWDRDHLVVQRLCARAREGVAVTVLARIRPTSMPALLDLREAGATVLGFRWLHAKAIWSDTGEALVMSANLQRDGLDRGFEVGVSLRDDRAGEVQERLKAWAARAQWRLEHSPRLGDIAGKAKLWHGSKLVDVEVEATAAVSLGELTASSADDLTAPEPPVPSNGELPRLAHELLCSWVVAAPVLQSKAKEIFRPNERNRSRLSYSPPVFEERRGRQVVAVSSPDQLPAAQRIRQEVGAAAIVVSREVGR